MLKQENIDKIVWGGIYKANSEVNQYCVRSNGNDQRYEYWVPAFNEKNGEYYMINTYQREDHGSLERIVENLEKLKTTGSYAVYHCCNYYYNSAIKLQDYIFDKFELVADLHDYEQTSCAYKYNEKDVIEWVQLYWEHAYPTGINIVKKNAKVDTWKEIDRKAQDALNSMRIPRVSNFRIVELEEILKNEKGNFNRVKVEAVLKLFQKVKQLENEYDGFFKTIEDDLFSEGDRDD